MTCFTIDTNVLVYAADRSAAARHVASEAILRRATGLDCRMTVQAVGEFFQAVTRTRLASRTDATKLVQVWLELFPVVTARPADVIVAVEASNAGRFQFYDALMLATAAAAGCEAIISEDMHAGARLGSIRVVAAFDATGDIAADARTMLGL